MFKTLNDIVGIPLEVKPSDFITMILINTHVADLKATVAQQATPKYIVLDYIGNDAQIRYYHHLPGTKTISSHTYHVNPTKLIELYNNKYKQSKLESFITRRKYVKG